MKLSQSVSQSVNHSLFLSLLPFSLNPLSLSLYTPLLLRPSLPASLTLSTATSTTVTTTTFTATTNTTAAGGGDGAAAAIRRRANLEFSRHGQFGGWKPHRSIDAYADKDGDEDGKVTDDLANLQHTHHRLWEFQCWTYECSLHISLRVQCLQGETAKGYQQTADRTTDGSCWTTHVSCKTTHRGKRTEQAAHLNVHISLLCN